tara:strand:- start:625 stop:1188 length:564 start_codon:yes stop_codon:yes gene_type:complete
MRIISGQHKGKRILEPKDKNTRPMKDLVKESIFNIIDHSNKFKVNLKNANILDLFSGVGSFGLESLSRGAKQVTFVENYPLVIKVLEKNIKNLDLDNKCKIFINDVLNEPFFDKLNNKYDIIFIDPPFKEKELSLIISKIFSSKILKKKSIIILHRKSGNKDYFPEKFRIVEEKKYGISKIIFGNYF